jgi:tRNA threonylcarbamoyladenosine biosynthesis protein TsaE
MAPLDSPQKARPEWSKRCKTRRGTQSLAKRLAACLAPGAVLALEGDLGAGKTTFIQGLAQGLGVKDAVVSPTYALLNVYEQATVPLVHIDLYRLTDLDSARALGLEEQVNRKDAIIAVEWADRLPDLFLDDTIWITLKADEEGGRELTVRGLAEPRARRCQ